MLRLLLATAWLAWIACAAPAAAQQPDPVQACYDAVNAKAAGACELCSKAVAASDDPHAKSAALMNLARCEEAKGQLVRAFNHYREARALMAGDDVRAPVVDERIAALAPRIGAVKLKWPEPGSRLRIDGVLVEGQPAELPIDPGSHGIEVTHEGQEPRHETLVVPEGGIVNLEVHAGDASSSAPTPAPSTRSGDEGDGQRIAAYVVGGFGVAALVVFGITGGLVLARQATVDEICPESEGTRTCKEQRGVDVAEEGRALGIANAVSLGFGVAGVVGAFILYFTAPTGAATGVTIDASPSGAALSFTGRF